MALQYDPRLYTGGNVVFDTSPTVEYAQRLQAKKQAKDEALNQYFNDLQTKINTAGVRVQDLSSPQGGINDEIEKWKQDWLLNKDSIKKGGLPQQEHLSKFQNILRRIDQSKNRAKTELEIGKAKFEGKYDPDDDDLNILGNIGKSIYDPTSYKQDGVSEYGWQDLSPAVPQFDALKQNQFFTAATKGMQPGEKINEAGKRSDPTTGKVFVPYETRYNPDQIKTIADNAAKMVQGDKSAMKYYKRLSEDVDQLDDLNKALQSVYGSRVFVTDAQSAAAADAILRSQLSVKTGEKDYTDIEAQRKREMEDFKVKQAIQDKYSKGRMNYAKALKLESGGEGDDELWLDNYLDNVVTEAANKRVSLPFFKQKIFKLQLDPTLARGLERNGIEPEELLYDEKTKTYKPVYYTYDDKGNRVEYKEISQPLTKEQLKLALGVKSVTPTQRTKEMKASQSTKPKIGELD